MNDLPTVVRHSKLNMYADDTEPHLSRLDLFSVQHVFSVTLILLRPGCVLVDFNPMYPSQLCC